MQMQFWRYGSQFFDADNDGDIDLLVGSGGNEKSDQANYKIACIWIMERDFTKSNISSTNNNVSVIAHDFDNDGDRCFYW
jgi:hypothetical protein